MWCSPGRKHSCRYPQPFGCDLQGKWIQQPQMGPQAQRFSTSMEATEIIPRRMIQRKFSKKLSPFASSASSCPLNTQNFAKKWANLQEQPTSGWYKSPKSRAKAKEASMPQEYCFHKWWQNHQPQFKLTSFSRLCFSHIWTTEKWSKGQYPYSVVDTGQTSVALKKWASLIKIILSYKGENKNLPVSLVKVWYKPMWDKNS